MKSSDKPYLEDIISSTKDAQEDFARNAFGLRVRKSAVAKCMKQADLSKVSGLSPNRIGEYWHGKKLPTGENLIALADALGTDPRWLLLGSEGTARQVIDEIDRLIEAGEDRAVDARKAELEAIALDPDIAQELRNRADFYLHVMGDQDARARRRTALKKRDNSSAAFRSVVAAALDQAKQETGVDLGQGVHQSLLSLGGYLLITDADNLEQSLLNYSVQQLAVAISARISGPDRLSSPQPAFSSALHSPRPGYRAPDPEGER